VIEREAQLVAALLVPAGLAAAMQAMSLIRLVCGRRDNFETVLPLYLSVLAPLPPDILDETLDRALGLHGLTAFPKTPGALAEFVPTTEWHQRRDRARTYALMLGKLDREGGDEPSIVGFGEPSGADDSRIVKVLGIDVSIPGRGEPTP
jgi:hypothetical protein